MVDLNLTPVLRTSVGHDPASVPAAISVLGGQFGATDVVVYLVDFGQTVLEPLGDYAAHGEIPQAESVGSTVAGRAFLTQRPTYVERPDGFRVWVPIREGSDRTGVIALTATDAAPETLQACEDLGVFAGFLIATHARVSDVFSLYRRRRAMSLPASMQWDLLPPLVFSSPQVTVAGYLEPAYEVGGDCFDYAVNGSNLDFAMMDSMGHGLNSAVLAALAVGCYRHDRRHGRTLESTHTNLDSTICNRYQGTGFVTGQMAQLNLETGQLFWTNAGHPLPLHIRAGKVVGELQCAPTLPWGLEIDAQPLEVAHDDLEPGDAVLFYTDGVVDGGGALGRAFGFERLTDWLGRSASEQVPPELIVRNLSRAILEHHGGSLQDDATLVMVQWHGTAS